MQVHTRSQSGLRHIRKIMEPDRKGARYRPQRGLRGHEDLLRAHQEQSALKLARKDNHNKPGSFYVTNAIISLFTRLAIP